MISALFIRRKELVMLCKEKKIWLIRALIIKWKDWLSDCKGDGNFFEFYPTSIAIGDIPPGIETFLYWCWFFIQLYHRFIRYRSFPTSLGSRTNQSPRFCRPASILIPHSNPEFLSFSHVHTTLTSALYPCIFLVWNHEKQFDRYCMYDCSKNIDMLMIVLIYAS